MNPTRWLLFAWLPLVCVVPTGGQEVKSAEGKRFNEILYPIERGFRWHYRVIDRKAPKTSDAAKKPPQIVVITAESEQSFKIKKKTPQKEWDEELFGYNLRVAGRFKTLPDGKIVPDTLQEQVLVADDGVYRVSGAGKIITPPLRILKKDARKGASWKCDSQSENAAIKGTFDADEEVVQVPAGKFATVAVRGDLLVGAQRMQIVTWYAPKVGMVKQHLQVGNHDVILELEKFDGK